MDYKFNSKNGEFTIFNPETGKDWSNKLFNDLSYVMNVTHFGSTSSNYIDKNSVQVTLNYQLSSFLLVDKRQPVRRRSAGTGTRAIRAGHI